MEEGQIVCEGGNRKASQPKPANAMSTPRTRGRNVDLKIR